MTMKMAKGKELTKEQKQENQEISRFKIFVEHAIRGAKRCLTVKELLRCHKMGFDDHIMELVCGLHTFRITLNVNALQN
jgi:hypothetical protein